MLMRPSDRQAPAAIEKQLKQLAEILKPDQMERLKQIDLQMQGPAALRNPEVIAALGLTLEQREKLGAIFKETEKRNGKTLQPTITATITMMGGKMPDDEELTDKVSTVLTLKQREKFEKMKGKPVDLGMQGVFGGQNLPGACRNRAASASKFARSSLQKRTIDPTVIRPS